MASAEARDELARALRYNIERLRKRGGENFVSTAVTYLKSSQTISQRLNNRLGALKQNLRTRFKPGYDPADRSSSALATSAIRTMDFDAFKAACADAAFEPRTITPRGLTFPEMLASRPELESWLRWFMDTFAVDANLRDGVIGDTPLIFAARLNNVAAVKLLIEAGADIAAANSMGETASSETSSEEVAAAIETYRKAQSNNPFTLSKSLSPSTPPM